MKYKPCCGRRCLLASCKTREAGGCYCLCRLKDMEGSLISMLKGHSYRCGPGVIYQPGRNVPLEGEEKEKVIQDLEKVRQMFKKYERENEETKG